MNNNQSTKADGTSTVCINFVVTVLLQKILTSEKENTKLMFYNNHLQEHYF